MAATAEQIGQIRLLIADVDPDDEAFTDAQVDEFFGLEGDSVNRAAARALEVRAADLINKVGAVRGILDAQLDAVAPAQALLDMAAKLRRGRGLMRSTWMSQWTAAEEAGG